MKFDQKQHSHEKNNYTRDQHVSTFKDPYDIANFVAEPKELKNKMKMM